MLVALLGAALGLAPALSEELVVVRQGATRSVPLVRQHGFAAARAVALAEALGFRWLDESETMEMQGERVRFVPGSPFFAVGNRVHQLPNPAYRDGPHIMVPVSWALDWLPRARSQRWRYLDGRLVERPADASRPPARESWLVVIDAGHGGRDPGAIGVRGTKEKDITLAIAKALAQRLRARGGIEVVLTRDRDTLVSLADRPRISQIRGFENPPDLFISIHGNSMPRKPARARGIETYFLAVAKTEQARQVAQRENSALQFETDAPEEYLEPLQFILSDLQSTANLRESSLLAAAIDASVREGVDAPSLGVRQAGLLVLVGATMPAVLVEVGFLSNREEEKLLRSASHQAEIADALADAVVNYLAEYGRRAWSSYSSGG
jgi:N-acetylmuramoyl-L-alanine amidase